MIGIYGGTFNPIHMGHLRAAEEVVEMLRLDEMIFVPSARPPHKSDSQEVIAPAAERLSWLRLAVEGHARFQVDPIEVERPGPSYLVDTLSELSDRFVDDELVFVVGQDAFREMGTWKAPEQLFAMAHVAVTTRPPVASGSLDHWIPTCVREDFAVSRDGLSAKHQRTESWVRQIPITPLDISSTQIRERLRDGATIRYLVPERVRCAIEDSGCYEAADFEGATASA